MVMVKDIPYAPSTDERLNVMLELAETAPNQTMVDLGSGDGKVVIAFAKKGIQTRGIEIDPVLVEKSLENIAQENLNGLVVIVNKSFWDVDLSDVDIVTIYGITSVMPRLEKKLRKELKPGAKVVANYFTFPNWKPEKEKANVYLYTQ